MTPTSENTPFRGNTTIDRLVHELSELPGIQAIFLGGSWSTGNGDKYSDIDIGILNDSGRFDDNYLNVIKGLAKHSNDIIAVNPWEACFYDHDRQLIHVRCASYSDWRTALDICETDPSAVAPNQFEILQTCHFLLPLFDPAGKAERFKQEAQGKADCFWYSYGTKHLLECNALVGHFQRVEKLPLLARALSFPSPLDPIFRTLGAINRCFYFCGSRSEDYLGCFPSQPERVRERLVRLYRLSPNSDDAGQRQTGEYASLVGEINGLFRDAFEIHSAITDAENTTSQRVSIAKAEEFFSVPAWIQTPEELRWHAGFVAGFVNDWPGPLRKYAERGDDCYFHGLLRDMINRLTCVLLRVNAIDSVPLRKLDETFKGLPIQPQNAYHRTIDILCCANPMDTLTPLKTLAQETEKMVKASEL